MKCKRQTDGRKYDPKTQEALRVQVVHRVQEGESPETLARVLDVHPRSVYRWLERYHYGGEEALKTKPRPGRPSKLTGDQMRWVAGCVRDHNPVQMRFPFALWTLGMIRDLIREQFAVRLSEVSVGRLMRTLGFTAQRPLYRAYQQDPVLVQEWERVRFPAIRRSAKKEKALVFFGDESSIQSTAHWGRTWAPMGERPEVGKSAKRFSLNMISAVSTRGELRFMVHEGTATARIFCEFLRRLVQGVDRKLYLIVDGHRIHRAREVQRCLEELGGQVKLFILPPYSPQLNPDEWVWSHVKREVGRQSSDTKEELKSRVLSALTKLRGCPEKIRGFFKAPSCQYILG